MDYDDAEMWSCVESGVGGVGGAPCARGKHSATLLGAHVYVLGGRGAGGCVPLRDFWRYCLARGEWERLPCGPPALQEHSASAHGDRLYVFGGEPGALPAETPLWVYHTETREWRKLSGTTEGTIARNGRKRVGATGGGAPRGRRGHSAHTLKDCLLIYGGYKDLKGSTNELWAFHYESETWQQVRTANAGPARHRHAAALHLARLYVHGGQCDLRDCSDLWHYDTISRVWTQVRTPAKLSPSARSGHAGLRAGAHFYIFGGEVNGHPTNELWRFHFESETWERIGAGAQWPSARVDACALLVPAAAQSALAVGAGDAGARAGGGGAPAGLLRDISKLSAAHVRRAARCSYTVLAAERDSTESLVRHEAALAKSQSAHALRRGGGSPRAADTPDAEPAEPAEGTKLVYLDSEDSEEEGGRRRRLPKSASVRFSRSPPTATLQVRRDDDSAELSTSDYASAEHVSGGSLAFSNPHYLGPEVRAEALALRPLGAPRRALLLLLLGGRDAPHRALLHSPLSMWTYRLL